MQEIQVRPDRLGHLVLKDLRETLGVLVCLGKQASQVLQGRKDRKEKPVLKDELVQ